MKVQKLKDSKRILIVSSEFPPQPGGIGNHAWNLANQLSIYGLDVTVFTDSRGTKLDEEITFDAAQAFTLKRVARKKPLILTYLNRLLSVRKLLKSSKPDVLILSGKFSVWMSVFFRKTCKVFVVVHGSELNLKNKIGSRLLNLGLQKCDKIIAVSNFTKSLLEERFQKKATVIFNGFRPIIGQIEKTAVKKDTVLNLITVGSLSQRKGQHNVIKALPILKKSFEKIHYHMVGAPVIQEDLQQLAYKLGVLDNVTFHGVVNDEELGVLLSNSDIFVMLSENTAEGDVEGFGIAILEANSCGLPAIGAINCGIEDAIDNYNSGILIDSQDPEKLKAAIDEILNKKEAYQKNCKKWSEKFQWKYVIQNYLNLIN